MTSARFKPILFTSIWTSSADGGGTSRLSIFRTLASPYSRKRTMRAIISPLIPFCIFVNATRRVSQLSAILLHQEQAGEIAKTQLLCVRMPLPRSEQKSWQPSSKLGGCSFARFCVYRAVEKLMHQRPNPIPLFFQREMARIKKIKLRAGDISFKEFSTLHRKDSVVFAPSDQHGRLLFAEIFLPVGKDIQIPFCVVED